MTFSRISILSGFIGLTSTASTSLAAGSGSVWLPPVGSDEARGVDSLFTLLLIVSVVLFLIVLGTMFVFIMKYRRQNDAVEMESSMIRPVWLALIVLPVVLVGVIFFISINSYLNLTTSPRFAYEVFVTGEDAAWTFEHDNGKIQDDGQLFVPADQPVRFTMISSDVTYAMVMPDFRLNQEVVPGYESSVWFQAAPGQYTLQGGEYCGPAYSDMNALMTAYPENEFGAALDTIAFWLDKYSNGELHIAGYRLFNHCNSCHTLDGSDRVGPSFRETFTDWGKTRRLADGRSVTIDEEYIRQSLMVPGADVVDRYNDEMTPFAGQFREREILALIAFIKRLDEVVDEQGNVIGTDDK